MADLEVHTVDLVNMSQVAGFDMAAVLAQGVHTRTAGTAHRLARNQMGHLWCSGAAVVPKRLMVHIRLDLAVAHTMTSLRPHVTC